MKKWFVVFLIFLAPNLLGSALLTNLAAGKSQTIVTYGTSLTALAAPGQWVTDLGNWLNGMYPGKVTIKNKGLSGFASNVGRNNLTANVLNWDPDVVFIEFSMNDAFDHFGISPNNDTADASPPITLERSRENLEFMISSIEADAKKDGRSTEIILMTMNPTWDGPPNNNGASYRPDLAQYYQVYRDVAAEQGLLLIDNYANWMTIRNASEANFRSMISDGVHPTASASSSVITPAIKQGLQAVPEPSVMALLGLSALAGIFYWRKCRLAA